MRKVRVCQTIRAQGGSASVTFRIEYRAEFGQVLKVVGAGDALGNWNPKDAPTMDWRDGNIWETTVGLPSGSPVEFKLVVTTPEGSTAVWEGGSNRLFTIPSLSSKGLFGSSEESAAYLLACQWANPSKTELERTGPEAVATDDEEGEVAVWDMRGNIDGYETDDEGKVVVTNTTASGGGPTATKEVGKMIMEDSAETSDTTSRQVGKMEVGKMEIVKGEGEVDDWGRGAEEGAAAADMETPIGPLETNELENPLSQVLNTFLQASHTVH